MILPVRNEAGYIRRALDAVAAQSYPADRIEVLVVDGMSTDGTRDLVASYRSLFSSLHLLDNPGQIVPTALNLGIRQARGEIVVRVDGHCEIAPDYVARCVAHLQENPGVSGVGGPIETIGETPIAAAIAVGMSSGFGVGGSAFRTIKDQTLLVDTVAFPAYPRPVLEQVGLFDEELVRNQDDEYNYRLRKLGGQVLLAADVRARYYSRSTLRSLWRQYYQYGFWKVRVLQKHPRQMQLRQFAPLLLVLGLVGSLLLGPGLALGLDVGWGWWLPGLAWGGYLALNLLASAYTAQERGWRHLPYLPVVFGILHIAYGLGFLHGLWHFRRRWRARGQEQND